MYDLEGKIAFVTGAASGIGFALVKALLKNKVKAVAMIDIDAEKGQQALNEVLSEFGTPSTFLRADITNTTELEDAFLSTVSLYKQIDIVVNNAGIFNEKEWEKCVSINLNGVITCSMLAMETYLPLYKSAAEGVVLNVASAAGVIPFQEGPVYAATKAAVVHFTRSTSGNMRYQQSKVRAVAICPGFTNTALAVVTGKQLNDPYLTSFCNQIKNGVHQDPMVLADNAMHVIKEGSNGSIWLAVQGDCKELEFPDFCYGF